MRIFLIISIFLFLSSYTKSLAEEVITDSAECSENLPPSDLMMCEAILERRVLEKDMQDALHDVIKRLRHPESKKYLEIAQKNWQQYVSSSCDYETLFWMGGSSASNTASRCEANYMRHRIEELKNYIDCDTDGCP